MWRGPTVSPPARVTTPAAATGPRGSWACFASYLGVHSSCAEASVLLTHLPPPSKVTGPWVSSPARGTPSCSFPQCPLWGSMGGSPGHRACGTPGPSLTAHWSLCGGRELWGPGELRSLHRGGGAWPRWAPCCPLTSPAPHPPRDASTLPWGLLEIARLSRDTEACSSWGRGSLRHLRIDVSRCLLTQPFLGNPPPSPVCSTSQLARPGNVYCEWDEPLPLSRPRQRM